MKIILVQKAVNAVDIPAHIRQSHAFMIQINFFIGGILNTYQQWIQGNLECSTEEIQRQVANLIIRVEDLYLDWGES